MGYPCVKELHSGRDARQGGVRVIDVLMSLAAETAKGTQGTDWGKVSGILKALWFVVVYYYVAER